MVVISTKKHAYLIMVHKNTYVLEKLLSQLDYEYNDIYIHIDKKCQNFDWNRYSKLVKKSQLFEVKKRVDCTWGNYSLIQAELNLLSESYNRFNYHYYHLLSGQDLSLKSQHDIHNFFDENYGKIFMTSRNIQKNPKNNFDFTNSIYCRASVKRIFLERSKINNYFLKKFLGLLDRIFALFQIKYLKRDLVESKKIQLAFGANWFSIPDTVVKCILDNQSKIFLYFKDAFCPDELFIQTILKENDIKVENNNLRLVDWSRGNNAHPHVWRSGDLNQLLSSDKLFARKFDENIDKKIIDELYNRVSIE